MDRVMLDRGPDTDLATCQRAAAESGATCFAVYIGGRSLVFDPWSPDRARGLLNAGFEVLAIYAMGAPHTEAQGSADGNEAAVLAGRYGIPAAAPIALDVEPSMFRADNAAAVAYVTGWAHSVSVSGYWPCGYCTPDGIRAMWQAAGRPALAWVADYPLNAGQLFTGASTAAIPGLQDDVYGGARAWQHSNEITYAGVDWDVSVVEFPLTGEGGFLMALTEQQQTELAAQVAALYETFTQSALPQSQSWLDVLSHMRSAVDQISATVKGFDPAAVKAELDAIRAAIASLGTGGLTQAQQAELDSINAAVGRMEGKLGGH